MVVCTLPRAKTNEAILIYFYTDALILPLTWLRMSQVKEAEHEENGFSVHAGACEKEVTQACFDFICERLQKYLSLPAAMSSAQSKRHFLPISTTPSFTEAKEYFHRSGFMLPMVPCVEFVLKSLLSGSAGTLLENLLGNNAVLREATAIISQPGVTSQAFHSDGNWDDLRPRVITVFLALQDIFDEIMDLHDFALKRTSQAVFWKMDPTDGTTMLGRNPTWFKLSAGDAILMIQPLGIVEVQIRHRINRTLLSFSC